MSQENVEIVRAVIDAFNRGDFEAAFKDVAPSAEVDLSRAVGPVACSVSISGGGSSRTSPEIGNPCESSHTASSKQVSTWSSRGRCTAGAVRVLKSSLGSPGSGRSVTTPSSASACTRSVRRPSKPPGFGTSLGHFLVEFEAIHTDPRRITGRPDPHARLFPVYLAR